MSPPRLAMLCLALLAGAGCAPQRHRAAGDALFDGDVEALMPMHDGDTFLYLVSGGPRGERLALSRVSAMDKSGDLEVTISEREAIVSRLHLRQTGDALLLVGEMDVAGNVGVLYASPLPLIIAPLRRGERRARSAVDVFRPSDGIRLSGGEVELTVSVGRDPAGDLAVHSRRRMKLPDREVVIEDTRWLRPGVGQLRAEAGVNGVVAERHELVCATIAGKRVGTCPAL